MTVTLQQPIIFSDLPGADRFNSEWRARSSIIRTSRSVVRDMIEQRHYLRCLPAVVPCVLAMKVDEQIMGAIVFALPPRETSTRYGGTCWELARLWIDDAVPRNAETWFIGQAVKYIRRHFPDVEVLVSYADPSAGHNGTIYKAANWIADGMTDDERKTPRHDYVANGKRYQRMSHIPEGVTFARVPRISKYRYYYRLR